ncbi:Extracellular exo-polygalacturonase [Mycena indigotica]|uniref:Extracellular exo-polygalacturonase n=1 Tax=Mycena indigotica TaxID=2126181 RepID=A0A8H6S267_9AGAR|nr:Extracellular exo-polygalacturonase [Mycena indigotica]KAF7291860.1 Extracellular exo-polygalacturonase [Mycena indigotica]
MCTPSSAQNSGVDDVPAIDAAIKTCGNGGIIVIPIGVTYSIRSVLSFTGCVNCDFQIEGTMKLSDNTTFWNGKKTVYDIASVTGLHMHSVTGTGLIDGNGVPYWTLFAEDSSFARPTLVTITSSTSITISNLHFRNAPNVFHSVSGGSTNIIYDGLQLDATSTATVTAKNTDGFDVGSSSHVTIKNTNVVNQDDCVALKPGSDFALVQNITCNGSHSLSVGSLGKGVGSSDKVTNAFLGPATMINSAKAVGIKLYEGGSSHGVATVSNITWSDITVKNCDYAVQIQSCYSASNTSNCLANTDSLTGVVFKNIVGTTSSHYSPVVANINCSPSATCNVTLPGFNVKPPSGTAQILCSNIDGSPSVTCTGPASG